MPTPQVNPLKR